MRFGCVYTAELLSVDWRCVYVCVKEREEHCFVKGEESQYTYTGHPVRLSLCAILETAGRTSASAALIFYLFSFPECLGIIFHRSWAWQPQHQTYQTRWGGKILVYTKAGWEIKDDFISLSFPPIHYFAVCGRLRACQKRLMACRGRGGNGAASSTLILSRPP